MKKDLKEIEQQNQLIVSKFIRRSVLAFVTVLPITGGFFLLWLFLSSIGRAEIFQLLASDTSTIIMISIAYFIYIIAMLYIIYYISSCSDFFLSCCKFKKRL
jgi:flagellar biosynthesis protein FlhB